MQGKDYLLGPIFTDPDPGGDQQQSDDPVKTGLPIEGGDEPADPAEDG